MSIPKHGKRDGNEKEIELALRAAGASVVSLSLRDGPDLLVGVGGFNFLLEIKNVKGKLREGQKKFADNWQGQYVVVRTVEEALNVVTRQVDTASQ